jgi:hypothetical protein
MDRVQWADVCSQLWRYFFSPVRFWSAVSA